MGRRWLAIDPGTEQSGYVVYEDGKVLECGVLLNQDIVLRLQNRLEDWGGCTDLVLEMVASYGMAVGREVFETCVWIGRFGQAWGWNRTHRLFRRDVKLFLCHNLRAKDANIRQALIDRFGPVGTKRNPGPLYGVKSHIWSALALAVTADAVCPREATA